MDRRTQRWLMILTLFGFVLRVPGLLNNSLHPDEALFATWAREIAIWRDPFLSLQLVDKPPLLFYLQALFFPLLGPVEMAGRMPGFIASTLLIPQTGWLGYKLFRDSLPALAAAGFLAACPLAIAFSATAFIDPLLTAMLVASIAVQVSVRSPDNPTVKGLLPQATTAGIFFGLAAASKHQAWLFLPLVVGIAVARRWSRRHWLRWLMGIAPMLGLLLAWDLLSDGKLSLWSAQTRAYGGLRLSWSWELRPRLQAWLELWRYVIPSATLALVWLAGLLPAVASTLKGSPSRKEGVGLLMLFFVLAYAVVHWLLAIPAWDRYLLPLLPWVAVLFGFSLRHLLKSVGALSRSAGVAKRRTVPAAWLAVLLPMIMLMSSAWQAREGQLPVGGYPAADSGVSALARALDSQPYGTVVYDHWYSWQLRYHLLESKVYISWFESPGDLAEDLTVFGRNGQPRYLVLPAGPEALPVVRAVKEAGFTLQEVERALDANRQTSLYLYRVRAR